MMKEGMRRAETRRIKKLCGLPEVEPKPFNLSDTYRYWAVEGFRPFIPLPPVSPSEVASIAANLLPRQKDERAACETALRLIRESAALIEAEKEKDRQTQGHLEDNEANRRMWRNLGKRIERIKKGRKPFRSSRKNNSDDPHDSLYPFPISLAELVALAGLEERTGRKRIDKALIDWSREGHEWSCKFAKQEGNAVPGDLTEAGLAAYVKSFKDHFQSNGIFQPWFLRFAEIWPELSSVMAECRKEK